MKEKFFYFCLMKNSILTLLLTCCLINLNAQETASLTINFSPQNVVIRIDNSEVVSLKDKPKPYTLFLAIGLHKVEAWAEGFEIQEYEIEISSKEVNQLNIGMSKLKPEFQAYLDAQDAYTGNKAKVTTVVGLAGVLTGGAVVLLIQGNNEEGKLFDNLENARGEYSMAINSFELSNAEQKHTDTRNAIRNRSLFGIISGTLAVGASTIAVRYFKKKKVESEIERPVYEEANPFVLYNYPKKNNAKFKLTSNGIVLNF
ncbi:MAG: hypothetical protein ACI85O_000209 [Saprospiraceae bacterium]|jgi:hypothetical protein